MTMKSNSQTGFTVVELMIGILSASILALAVGIILANAYRGWVRGLAVADMERDASVAIHTLDLAVRGATNVVGGVTLTVYDTNGISRVFSTTGVAPRGSLLYSGMTLVNGRLVSFTNSVSAGMVSVTLTLSGIDQNNQDTGVRMGVTNMCIQARNVP